MKQILITFSLFFLCILSSSAQNWKILFDGSDLAQWEKRGGNATYEIQGGAIVGTAVPNTPNTFLCTKEKFSDFILELEVLLPNDLNSGVQFRSNVHERGHVFGYQCEIDPSKRRFTAGIYDESRRGWLYPLSRNPKAQDAFEMAKWNSIRIECLGNEIRTYVNGQMASNLIDDETAKGFFGLQVHSIGDKRQEGFKVMWKNIRILTENVKEHRWPTDPDVPQISYLKNQLTEWEKAHGWQLLWDGQSTKGWRDATHEAFPDNAWKIENGELTVLGIDEKEKKGSGDIITKERFSNFELELEFKVGKAGNSGIKYFVNPDLNDGKGSTIGCEFQILDDANHEDAPLGKKGNRTVASLYDLIAADNLTTPGRGKQFKGLDRWNKARIVVKDGNVEHWLNNEKAVEYNRFSQIFQALVNYSKFENDDHFGQWLEGAILLQDHGDQVSFRSIKIRRL
jgi:hypothetical protein